ncbi:hypothetical protein NP233_g2524 [Leucocoprinus birnbaumii]|uniref:Transmembrane protein n=1 Tax=Leucocoprinus birnbaumii TaxID=56174 RepID=A0AAD5W0J5_9AGAR|nr:hypothetical protein NP233_g2524 [Leucocoprinus birnbaumii]
MRTIHYERALRDSICLLHILILSSISAAPTQSTSTVTIPITHSSVTYSPPESWSFVEKDRIASRIRPVGSVRCIHQQVASYGIAALGGFEQKGEQRRRSIRTNDDFARPPNQAPDGRDDWRKESRSFCSGQKMGYGSCFSEAVETDAFSITDHPPMTLRVRFTGSAVYLFGIATSPSLTSTDIPLPTLPCISFTVDGQQLSNLTATDVVSPEVKSCSMKEPIFSHLDLPGDREHELLVTISPSTIFALSHIVYTRRHPTTSPAEILRQDYPQVQSLPALTSSFTLPGDDARIQSTSEPHWRQVTLRPRAEEASSSRTTETNKKHNVATFAAAVGTVVGILALVSLVVAFSIIRRRRLAHLRDADPATDNVERQVPHIRARRISSSSTSSSVSSSASTSVLHTEASEDTPNPIQQQHMMQIQGPRPSIPRFFPGTTVLPQQAHSAPLLHPPPLSSMVYDVEDQNQNPEQDPPSYDDSVAISSLVVAPGHDGTGNSIANTINGSTGERRSGLLGTLRSGLRGVRRTPDDDEVGSDTGAVGVRSSAGDYYPSYADVPPPTPPPMDMPVSSSPISLQSPQPDLSTMSSTPTRSAPSPRHYLGSEAVLGQDVDRERSLSPPIITRTSERSSHPPAMSPVTGDTSSTPLPRESTTDFTDARDLQSDGLDCRNSRDSVKDHSPTELQVPPGLSPT